MVKIIHGYYGDVIYQDRRGLQYILQAYATSKDRLYTLFLPDKFYPLLQKELKSYNKKDFVQFTYAIDDTNKEHRIHAITIVRGYEQFCRKDGYKRVKDMLGNIAAYSKNTFVE